MRTVFDDRLMEWEAWASPSPGGLGNTGRIVFRCLTDPTERPRALELGQTRAVLEGRLEEMDQAELVDLLAEAEAIR